MAASRGFAVVIVHATSPLHIKSFFIFYFYFFLLGGGGKIWVNTIMVRIPTEGMQDNTEDLPEMGVTEIILAKIYGVCELSSHSRGIEF
jgi:hypothetical protein